jgi:hypothetical protein
MNVKNSTKIIAVALLALLILMGCTVGCAPEGGEATKSAPTAEGADRGLKQPVPQAHTGTVDYKLPRSTKPPVFKNATADQQSEAHGTTSFVLEGQSIILPEVLPVVLKQILPATFNQIRESLIREIYDHPIYVVKAVHHNQGKDFQGYIVSSNKQVLCICRSGKNLEPGNIALTTVGYQFALPKEPLAANQLTSLEKELAMGLRTCLPESARVQVAAAFRVYNAELPVTISSGELTTPIMRNTDDGRSEMIGAWVFRAWLIDAEGNYFGDASGKKHWEIPAQTFGRSSQKQINSKRI